MYAVTQTEFGGPETLQWAEVPDAVAGPGQVVVKIVAAGVNRADLLQRQGFYPPPPGSSDIIGLECAGTIASVGEGVAGWTVGDECVALLAGGGYAEQVAVPAGQVISPPEGVELVTAGSVMEVAATVVSMTQLARLERGETFLVHGGAGGIGTFAIQYGRAESCRVIATAGNAEKVAYCRELGADLALDYHDDWVSAVQQAGGADVILDVMGASYLRPNIDALAHDGRLAIIGLQGGTKGELDLGAMLPKRATVIAASLRSRPLEQKAQVVQAVREKVWPKITSRAIRPGIETRIPMADAAEAHVRLESGENLGKIVLTT